MKYFSLIIFTLLNFVSCTQQKNELGVRPYLFEADEFKNYWYAGDAEISVYELDQARYGENHTGKAALIFVTEDLSAEKQVKLDRPEQAIEKVNVLKLNYMKNFITGIYPYSMMLSVFTPVQRDQHPRTLKLSMSSQEWCGHVYAQLNLEGNFYNGIGHSYFEQEADSKFNLPGFILEDELFNLIRLDPNKLPSGKHQIIPGLFNARIKHETLRPKEAMLSIEKSEQGINYKVSYTDGSRVLLINFDEQFPHQINAWREYMTDYEGRQQVTSATLSNQMKTNYWSKNKQQFLHLRDSLGLHLNY